MAPSLTKQVMGAEALGIFRLLVGLLGCAYFISLLLQVPDFSSVHGLIDHELSFQLFWFTRIGLFQGSPPDAFFYVVFGAASLLSVALGFGYRTRASAFVLYLIAVSNYRWNFLVIYVDDVIMHLLFFWSMLLPVASPVKVKEAFGDPRGVFRRWSGETVSAFPVFCFLLNVALAYWVAGLSKWSSQMWLDGSALYAVLKVPVARFPDFWTSAHLPLLEPLNYATLFLEVLLPFALFQRRSSWGFALAVVTQAGFHLGIVALIGIPFANVGLIASSVLFAGFRRRAAAPELELNEPWRARIAVGYLAVLSLACLYRVKVLWPVVQGAYAILWIGGLAQNYHLFDWIDERNYAVREEVELTADSGSTRRLDPAAVFGRASPRHVLLEMNLHGMAWLPQASSYSRALRLKLTESTKQRHQQRFCGGAESAEGVVCARTTLGRVRRDNLDVERSWTLKAMCFRCSGEPLQTSESPRTSSLNGG